MQCDGNAAFKQGNFDRAIELYSKCLDLDDSMTAAHANRAMAYLKVGKAEEALADCNVVLEREPGNVKCWLRKGQACADLQRVDDAIASWEECLRLQPSNAQAAERLQMLGGQAGGS
jgi:tetratricopeptide (TPR) repeat protein